MESERWKTQQQNPGYVDGDEGVHDDDSIADKQKTNKQTNETMAMVLLIFEMLITTLIMLIQCS